MGRYLPTTFCAIYYGLQRMKEEQGSLLQHKKSWWQQGLNPWLQGDRPATKPLSHKGLLISRAWFFHYTELATCCEYAVTDESHCTLCKRPKLTLAKHASVVYEPGATKLSFFLQQWPKKRPFSHCVKCNHQQQALKKMMSPIMASISRNSSNKVPTTILPMFRAGRLSHKKWAVF